MSLATPTAVQKLRAALHAQAKGSPNYRFYMLHDEVYRADVLAFAYRCCRGNGGVPGVDGQDFADIEAYGLERWLGERTEALKKKTCRAQAVRRVWVPKPDGQQRPLGIPTVKDRVVQTAAKLVLEPIPSLRSRTCFEADLQPEQYAYRPERSALDAVKRVHALVNTGHTQVVDADLSGYFDSIPHTELLKSVARRISDRHMLHLIKMGLQMPVEETDERGHTQRTTRNLVLERSEGKDEHRGTPQGSPISPLLSNLYRRRFILGWKSLGHAERLKAQIVNYADDFVICCRGTAEEAVPVMRSMMERLKLTVNEPQTRVCRLAEETFDFLGDTLGRCYSTQTGKAYLGTRPSKKRITRLCRAIREITTRRWTPLESHDRVAKLNRMFNGWANYFCLGPVSKAYRIVDIHARHRLRQWWCAKHKIKGQGSSQFPDEYLDRTLGLVRLQALTRNFPWANA